jgi:hypothetical protein
VQVLQLAIKLLSQQPKLRIMELVFVLNGALAGEFGAKEGSSHFQRIGIDTILGWLTRFYEQSSLHLEQRVTSLKQDESRGDAPWEVVERQMKAYQREQREKKDITEKVWGIEKRAKQIEEYKANLEKETGKSLTAKQAIEQFDKTKK